MSKKQPSYKIPFSLNGDMMDYLQDEHFSARNYDEDTGECEVRHGFRDGSETWEKINLHQLRREFQISKSRYSEGDWNLRLPPEMRDVYVFEDVLTYTGYGKGRSAVHFNFKDSAGRRYNMFISEFSDLIQRHTLKSGVTPKLRWTFVKKGLNYSIKLA